MTAATMLGKYGSPTANPHSGSGAPRELWRTGRKMAWGSQSDKERFQRFDRMLRKEMEFERAFVRAGGLLMAGSDAVIEGDIAGFGNQRELELLVEAGFTPEEAIQIATLNGARFLKRADHIGSLAVGKQADIPKPILQREAPLR
jgi:imidazolonepropionase-like amidohydrolase